MKIILTKGLISCGKTTWAKQYIKDNPNTKIICKDDLRLMLDDSVWSKNNEKFILKIRNLITEECLKEGYDVIIADTNLHSSHKNTMWKIAAKYDATVEVKEFNVPVEECIRRDSKRDNPVGKKNILRMAKQFGLLPEEKQLNPIVFDKDLPYCLICDIDGSIAHRVNRSPYDMSKVKDDVVNGSVRWLVNEMHADVIMFSGREDVCQKDTEDWLFDNNIDYKELHMRKTGDKRDDAIVKREMFEEFIKDKYNVIGTIDDRKRVKKMWVELGVTVFDVNQNDTEF